MERRRKHKNVKTYWLIHGREIINQLEISQAQFCEEMGYKSRSSFEDVLRAEDVGEFEDIYATLNKLSWKNREVTIPPTRVLMQLRACSILGAVSINGVTYTLQNKKDIEDLLDRIREEEIKWDKAIVKIK